ncbi:DNA-binding transcription repressor [Cladochytrium tenue]|nr:DNA-binding transcription repressor [Cladochytrium tenue]
MLASDHTSHAAEAAASPATTADVVAAVPVEVTLEPPDPIAVELPPTGSAWFLLGDSPTRAHRAGAAQAFAGDEGNRAAAAVTSPTRPLRTRAEFAAKLAESPVPHTSSPATTPAAALQDPALPPPVTLLLDASPSNSRASDTAATADAPTPVRARRAAAIAAAESYAALIPRPRRQRRPAVSAVETAQRLSSPTSHGVGTDRVIVHDVDTAAGLPVAVETAGSLQQPPPPSSPAASISEVESKTAVPAQTPLPALLAVGLMTPAPAPTPRARRAAAAAAIDVFAAMAAPKRRTSRVVAAATAAAKYQVDSLMTQSAEHVSMPDTAPALPPAATPAGPKVVEIGADAARADVMPAVALVRATAAPMQLNPALPAADAAGVPVPPVAATVVVAAALLVQPALASHARPPVGSTDGTFDAVPGSPPADSTVHLLCSDLDIEHNAAAASAVPEVGAGAPTDPSQASPVATIVALDFTAVAGGKSSPSTSAVGSADPAPASTPRARRAAAAAAIAANASMAASKRRTSRASYAAVAASRLPSPEPTSLSDTATLSSPPAPTGATTTRTLTRALALGSRGSRPTPPPPPAFAVPNTPACQDSAEAQSDNNQVRSLRPNRHRTLSQPPANSGRRHPAHSTAGYQMGITAGAANSAVPVSPKVPAASTVVDEATTFPPARSPWPKRRRTLSRATDGELPVSPAVSGGDGANVAASAQVARDAVAREVADLGPPTPSSSEAPTVALMSPNIGGGRGFVQQVSQAHTVQSETNFGVTLGAADAAIYSTAALDGGLTTKSPRRRRPLPKMPTLEHPPRWLWDVDRRPMLDLRLPAADSSLDVLDSLLVPNNHTCELTPRRTSRRLTGADKLREEVLEDEVKHRRARLAIRSFFSATMPTSLFVEFMPSSEGEGGLEGNQSRQSTPCSSNLAEDIQGISDFVEQTQTSAFMEMLAPAAIAPKERTLSSKTSRWRRSVCEAAIGGSTALRRFGAPAERAILILSSFLDASIDGHDCLGRESHQPVKKRRISHPRAGDVAQRAEEEWTVPARLRELYARKTYLFAGLYSDTFKKDAGSPRIGAKSQLRPFNFSMPIFHGNSLLDTIEDFELPYDLVLGEELRSIDGGSRLDVLAVERKPRNFVKISRNIFVDRRPNNPNNTPVCDCLPDGGGAVGGCDESCLNRCMQIECEPQSCPCGPLCSNQAFQRQDSLPAVEVFWAARRGHGLRAKEPVRGGSLIIEYRGEVISTATCLARMRGDYAAEDNFYFLDYGAGEVLDACRKGTEARFVNHSCSPNCYIDKWLVRGEHRVGVFALRDIPPGTELTYDYKLQSFGPMQQCLCGSNNCRGDCPFLPVS